MILGYFFNFSKNTYSVGLQQHTLKKIIPELHVQSTLIISNSKGLSKILRDIHTSTYQICRVQEKII